MTDLKAMYCDTDKSNLKVTMEAQLGLIGGTMGLLTGFSILRCLILIRNMIF